jgi:hypothetical protein
LNLAFFIPSFPRWISMWRITPVTEQAAVLNSVPVGL